MCFFKRDYSPPLPSLPRKRETRKTVIFKVLYDIDAYKALVSRFRGSICGSRPLVSDHAGPINHLQKIYAEYYELDEIPTIMGSQRFSYEKNIPVYYSMQLPTMISSNPNFRCVKISRY